MSTFFKIRFRLKRRITIVRSKKSSQILYNVYFPVNFKVNLFFFLQWKLWQFISTLLYFTHNCLQLWAQINTFYCFFKVKKPNWKPFGMILQNTKKKKNLNQVKSISARAARAWLSLLSIIVLYKVLKAILPFLEKKKMLLVYRAFAGTIPILKISVRLCLWLKKKYSPILVCKSI